MRYPKREKKRKRKKEVFLFTSILAFCSGDARCSAWTTSHEHLLSSMSVPICREMQEHTAGPGDFQLCMPQSPAPSEVQIQSVRHSGQGVLETKGRGGLGG